MNNFIVRWTNVYDQLLTKNIVSPAWQRIILGLILTVCVIVRLLTISAPALDRTAWKEIDYLMISTNYWQSGFNFLRPEVSWPAEPPHVTEMEFPLVPFSAALLYKIFGFNVYTARLITLFAFLLLAVYVFKLAQRELGPIVGITAAFAAAVMPLYHPMGRYLFTEPLMIAMSVVTLYHLAEWVDFQRRRDWILSLFALSLTIALKVEVLYLFLPISWLAFRKYRWQLAQYKGLLAIVFLAILLPIAWYAYAYYLENIGAHVFGIFKGHNKFQTLTMLTTPSWYRTMGRRMIVDILGGIIGPFLCIIGLLAAARLRQAGLFFVYLAAIGVYVILVAEGNLDAPYRQLTSVPPLSMFVAMGAVALLVTVVIIVTSIKDTFVPQGQLQIIVLVGCIVLLSLVPLLRYNEILGRDGPSHPYRWQISQEIEKYTASDSKLVVAGEYSIHVGGNDLSPVLYHYTGLQGWSLQPEDWNRQYVESLIQKGATHFVVLATFNKYDNWPFFLAPDFIQEMKAHYKVLCEDEERPLLILDLRQPNNID
ncbi:ArnT family glycosyltransferase [Chloroflexota bacterium]